MKAGTTSLHRYLLQHPNVRGACRKEVHYFDKERDPGPLWYRAHFPARTALWARGLMRGPIRVGEASPRYLFDPAAAGRAGARIPDARILAILRNPVDRAWSHYHHSMRLGRDDVPFDEAIARELAILRGDGPAEDRRTTAFRSYLRRGLYAGQLVSWFEHFPRERVLVLEYGRFFADPERGVQRATDFLGLPPAPARPRERLEAGDYPPMPPAVRSRLEEFFAPHHRRLAEVLGEEIAWSPGPGAAAVRG